MISSCSSRKRIAENVARVRGGIGDEARGVEGCDGFGVSYPRREDLAPAGVARDDVGLDHPGHRELRFDEASIEDLRMPLPAGGRIDVVRIVAREVVPRPGPGREPTGHRCSPPSSTPRFGSAQPGRHRTAMASTRDAGAESSPDHRPEE